jgi:hypothetical protein
MLPKPIRNSSGKNKPALYFEVLKGTVKGLNHKGIPKAISATPRIADSRQSIFDYEYLLDFGFKIEKVTAITYRDLCPTDLHIKKSRNPPHWNIL